VSFTLRNGFDGSTCLVLGVGMPALGHKTGGQPGAMGERS
jgi:hypothetical protein